VSRVIIGMSGVSELMVRISCGRKFQIPNFALLMLILH